jgi:hypothetical protein
VIVLTIVFPEAHGADVEAAAFVERLVVAAGTTVRAATIFNDRIAV